jgi:hypothetical protein
MSGSDGSSSDPNAPPEGSRFRIKRSVDLTSLGLTSAEYAIAKAAQDYGFIITDGGDNASAGLENTVAEGRGWLWNGVLSSDALNMLPFDDYEFVQLGWKP